MGGGLDPLPAHVGPRVSSGGAGQAPAHVRPSLPSWLGRADISGLRVAGSSMDLRFERAGDEVRLAEAQVDGALEIVQERRPRASS